MQLFSCPAILLNQRGGEIVIVPAPQGGPIRPGLAFLSGAPRELTPSRTTIAVTAIDQGGKVDPLLLKVLSSGPYAGLSLKPASGAPKSLRLAPHDHKWNSWLCKIVHEAEEISAPARSGVACPINLNREIEELLGLETHPFGGAH